MRNRIYSLFFAAVIGAPIAAPTQAQSQDDPFTILIAGVRAGDRNDAAAHYSQVLGTGQTASDIRNIQERQASEGREPCTVVGLIIEETEQQEQRAVDLVDCANSHAYSRALLSGQVQPDAVMYVFRDSRQVDQEAVGLMSLAYQIGASETAVAQVAPATADVPHGSGQIVEDTIKAAGMELLPMDAFLEFHLPPKPQASAMLQFLIAAVEANPNPAPKPMKSFSVYAYIDFPVFTDGRDFRVKLLGKDGGSASSQVTDLVMPIVSVPGDFGAFLITPVFSFPIAPGSLIQVEYDERRIGFGAAIRDQ